MTQTVQEKRDEERRHEEVLERVRAVLESYDRQKHLETSSSRNSKIAVLNIREILESSNERRPAKTATVEAKRPVESVSKADRIKRVLHND